MTVYQSIFLKIAKMLGLELREAKGEQRKSDYKRTDDISLTAVMANSVATQITYGSKIIIKGENKRAEYLRKKAERFDKVQMSIATEVCLGTGGAIVKPYTDGDRIGIDIVDNECIQICESVGDFIKSVIMKAEEFKDENGNVYKRYEAQSLKTALLENGSEISACVIYQFAFKNDNQIPLTAVKDWESIQPETIIPNVDRLLFGYYKCPTVNRNDVNSPKGVSITYGAEKAMEKAVQAYYRYNDEFERKEAYIFADKTALKVKKTRVLENGMEKVQEKTTVPNGKDHVFIDMRKGEEGKLPLEFYSPEIRGDVMKDCVDFDLRIVEMICGFSTGVLTLPNTQNATATEIDALKTQTFAFVDQAREFIEQGNNDLIYAINVLCNANNITPIGDYEFKMEWSKELKENLDKKFERLMRLQAIGAYGTEEMRAFETKEDLQTARERVEEIKETFVSEEI